MILVDAGSTLPIVLQLGTGDVGLFVRCNLINMAGTTIATVALTEVGQGLYVNFTQLKDAEDFTIAQFRVFDDAGFTIRNVNNQDSVDIFVKNNIDVSALVGGETLKGILSGDDVKGIASADDEPRGIVSSESVIGVVSPESELTGVVGDNQLKGKTNGC